MARPTRVRGQVALAPKTMPLQLSMCWCPDWLPGASKQARKESNLRSSVLETATPPWLEPGVESSRMTLCAMTGEALARSARRAAPYQRTTGLPVLAAARRSGFNSWSSREPGRHAYAPKLDRA